MIIEKIRIFEKFLKALIPSSLDPANPWIIFWCAINTLNLLTILILVPY